jgi:hypothetical protein
MSVPFKLTMAANEVREFAMGGNYIELRAAAGIVAQIELLDRSGGVIGLMVDAEATDYQRVSRSFEQVRVTNGATPQTVVMYYGDGDSGSNRFTGVVSGIVELGAATLAAIAALIDAARRPYTYTGTFSTTTAAVANTAQTIFAPAANTNGVILMRCSANDRVDLDATAKFIAHTAAPTTVNQGVTIAESVSNYITPASTNEDLTITWDREFFIPAGMGLYYISDSASQVAKTSKSATWRAL